MSNKKIFVSRMSIDYATWIDATYLDNIAEETIQSVDFNDYVDIDMRDDLCRLTINLEFDDVDPYRYADILSNTKRCKLISKDEYYQLMTALDIFKSVNIEFYIDIEGGDEEFTLKFIM